MNPTLARRLGRLRLPLLGGAAFCVALAAMMATRPGEGTAEAARVPVPRETMRLPIARQESGLVRPAATATRTPAATAVMSAAEAQQFIEQADSTDAQQRAAAIEALGRAPRRLALPVLERVVKSGEADVDRHVALGALHTLAMAQGDADGAISDLLRELIYDGNDEAVTENATAALTSLETPRLTVAR